MRYDGVFMKIDRSVKKETLIIAAGSLFLSAVMELIFLLAGAFDYTVPLGNLLGLAAAVGNFFAMGVSLQSAISTGDPDRARKMMRLSQSARFLGLIIIVAVAAVVPVFNIIAAVVPLIFPRAVIFVRALFIASGKGGDTENASGAVAEDKGKDGNGADDKSSNDLGGEGNED